MKRLGYQCTIPRINYVFLCTRARYQMTNPDVPIPATPSPTTAAAAGPRMYPMKVEEGTYREYKVVGTAGATKFGTVAIVEYKHKPGERYARKPFDIVESHDLAKDRTKPVMSYWTTFLNEYRALQLLSDFYGVCSIQSGACHYDEEKRKAYIVMRYLGPQEYISLSDLVLKIPLLSIPYCMRVVTNIHQVLKDLHSRGWIHNDLHLGNIMVHLASGNIKLIDLGLSVTWEMNDRITGRVKASSPSSPSLKWRIIQNGVLYDQYKLIQIFQKYITDENVLRHSRNKEDTLSMCQAMMNRLSTDWKIRPIADELWNVYEKDRFALFTQYEYLLRICERPCWWKPHPYAPNRSDAVTVVAPFTGGVIYTSLVTDRYYTPEIRASRMNIGFNTFQTQEVDLTKKSYHRVDVIERAKDMRLLAQCTANSFTKCIASWTAVDTLKHSPLWKPKHRVCARPYGFPNSPQEKIYKIHCVPTSSQQWELVFPNSTSTEYRATYIKGETVSVFGMFTSELQFLDAMRAIPGFQQIQRAYVTSDSSEAVIEYTKPDTDITLDGWLYDMSVAKVKWTDAFQILIAKMLCDLLACLHVKGIVHGRLSLAYILFQPYTCSLTLTNGQHSKLLYTERIYREMYDTISREDTDTATKKKVDHMTYFRNHVIPRYKLPCYSGTQCDYLFLANEFIQRHCPAAATFILHSMPRIKPIDTTETSSLLREPQRLEAYCKEWTSWFRYLNSREQEIWQKDLTAIQHHIDKLA